MRDEVSISFGGICVRIVASGRVCSALRARFVAFVTDPTPPFVDLRIVEREPFDPTLTRASSATLTATPTGRVALSSEEGSGWFDPTTRSGLIEDAANLGAVDALVRAALSLVLPIDGALILHGAVAARAGGSIAFLGASGAGKSTVAKALGAASDELVIARPAAGSARLWATPYWGGSPFDGDARALVCLSRGGRSVRRLSGTAAIRAVLPNVVHYVPAPDTDRALFTRVAELCEHVPVIEAACPTGPAFLPYLLGELQSVAGI